MKTIILKVRQILFLLFAFGIAWIGCESSPTESKPPEDKSQLLLDRLSVAMVPGGKETVIITATDPDNRRDLCSVNCDKPQIAQISLKDTLLTITGVNYGTANVTVTSQCGLSRTLPVLVYNHKVMDTGELLIAFVDTFEYRWHDGGSGQPLDGAYWHPVTNNGFRALGSLGMNQYGNPTGQKAVMVVKARENSDALAEPLDYTLVWSDQGSGANNDGSFWNPVPPSGYIAMGTVAQRGYAKPSLSDVVCVRQDLTVVGEAGSLIWRYQWFLKNYYKFASWLVDPPNAGPHDNAYLGTGTFIAVGSTTSDLIDPEPPSVHPVMHVLKLQLPLLSEAPTQSFVPELNGYDSPEEQTVPMFARAMLMPCTIVRDSLYDGDPMWRIGNSPLYRLEREVYYKLLYHTYNKSSQLQTNSVTITSGVTTTQSDKYWNSTAISISFESGVSIKMFDAKVTTTVSREFGYERQTSVAALQQKSVSTSVNTAPGKASALWQRYNRYVLLRHNGTQLEPVAAWTFGIDSYVVAEYP